MTEVWMRGTDIGTKNWPGCGEMDIMENIGKEPNIVHGTIHGPQYSGGNGIGKAFTDSAPIAQDFHVFAIEWEANVIRWYCDSTNYQTRTPVRQLMARRAGRERDLRVT